ncbi:formate dehydrogenase accessory sulfurtransferase FdhD [Listeria sp. PSOL-1]|uniref:formate dehydrogenase accessory sulfurtransferase FdhD n=1 Tax=Listeria sp. PSOL-1 TaxID=1844999 RepID=UPI0013D293BA|nr:formate dehydrogenase accessory sulfurtransferase FdhD [Listeria sp. PSOL-1]
MESSAKWQVIHYKNNLTHEQEASVAAEYPLTIFMNQKELITIVCTPDHLEDLIIGFLISEGVVSTPSDIEKIEIIEATGHAYVTAKFINQFNTKHRTKRYITSCCGKSRENFYFQADATLVQPSPLGKLQIKPDSIFNLMEQFEKESCTFHETGGVHNAGLCDASQIICSRMDIGRHNALDKIYGQCLQEKLTVADKIIIFSGRISSEILVKTAKIGVSMILSRSAPTELAIKMAEELNLTTVGFIRDESMNIYTGSERIQL